jgi:uncharacterized protein (TIGR03437 family)
MQTTLPFDRLRTVVQGQRIAARVRLFVLLHVLLVGNTASAQQQARVNVEGIWQLRTTTFSATVKIKQMGTTILGQMASVGNACATTGAFFGPIGTLIGLGLTMNVDMNGQQVSFSGDVSQSGDSMTGQYGASHPGCIGRGPYNWVASRSSTTFTPTISGVRNGASGETGPIAAGEVISIFANAAISPIGPTPGVGLQLDQSGKVATVLGGVQVRFLDINVLAPLTFVSAGQVNALVPYDVAGLTNVSLQVEYLGIASDPFSLQVTRTAPGIFTADGTGTGQAAALNHDGITANGPTHPELRGGNVVLFLTGEGQTTPAGITGKVTTISPSPPITPIPLLPVSVFINGQPATVAFYGEAPGLVSGVLQLNVTIPETASPGNVFQVKVLIGGMSTPNVVTISIL